MKKPESPCLNCPDRKVGCHGICDRFKAFRSAWDVWNDGLKKEAEAETVYGEFVKKSRDRSIKKLGKRLRTVDGDRKGGHR